MREIKFRGRYSPDHDWVYGDYYKYYDGSFMHVITYIDDNLMQNTLCPIDIDSLGQFIGLKDKHGVDCYESDIITGWEQKELGKPLIEHRYQIVWDDYAFVCKCLTGGSDVWLCFFNPSIKQRPLTEFEIIGNIHQHPELLK